MRALRKRRQHTKPITPLQRDVALVRRVHGRRLPRLRQFAHLKRILSRSERRMLLAGVLVLIVSIGWALLNYAGAYRVEVPAAGGSYREAVVGSPETINPLFSPLNDVDMDLVRVIYSGLMRVDREGRLVPDLAVRYEVSEDKKTYTFVLKENVRWHDGEQLTADDVVYTIQSIQDPAVGSPLSVSFDGVEVAAPDEYTVRFTLSEVFPSFLSSLTVGILPRHTWETIPADKLRLAQRNLKPIGTGPYKLVRILKDQAGFITEVELERFSDYYRQVPFITEFGFVYFSEYERAEGAIQALREGKVDGLHFIPFNLRDRVERKHIVQHTLQLPQYSALFINKDRREFLKQAEVRDALVQGIDKGRILHETLKNEGQVIHGPLLPGSVGFDPLFAPYEYSVETANALLDKVSERVDLETYRNKLKQTRLEARLAERNVTTTPENAPTDEDEAEAADSDTDAGTATPSADEVNADEERRAALEEEIEQELDQILNPAQLFYRTDKSGNVFTIDIATADTAEYHKAAELVAGAWQELGISTQIRYIPPRQINRDVLRTRDYDVLLYGIIVGSDPDQYPFWHSSQIDYPGLNLSRYVNRKVDEQLQKIRTTDADSAEIPALYAELQRLIVDDVPAIFLYTPTYSYTQTDKVQGFNVQRISHPSDRLADVNQWYVKTGHEWRGKQ